MILFQQSKALRGFLNDQKAQNKRIGFVPTMGALHAGHLSLIEQARQKCDIVVCSIFVNPTQFTQAADLETYPRPINNDIKLLEESKCDVLFHPSVDEIYANDLRKDDTNDYGSFVHVLEGASRPGHFDGVVTVVKKLFELVRPDEVFFGQKDYQQCLVVQTLINRAFQTIKFNLCAIAREADGLAMSSRNIRLSELERKLAPQLYLALKKAKQLWTVETWQSAAIEALKEIDSNAFTVEYLKICDQNTLVELLHFQHNAVVVLVAVQIGKTRLIDNILIDRD